MKILFVAVAPLLVTAGVAVATPVAHADYPCGSAAHPTPTQACGDCKNNGAYNAFMAHAPWDPIGVCVDPAGVPPPPVYPSDPRCEQYKPIPTEHAICIDRLMARQPPGYTPMQP